MTCRTPAGPPSASVPRRDRGPRGRPRRRAGRGGRSTRRRCRRSHRRAGRVTDRPPLETSMRVAEMQAGLREDGGRGDDLAGSREPSPGDQLVADPARVAVIADERDRGEPSDARRRLAEGRRIDRSRAARRSSAVSAAPLAAGSSSSTLTGLAIAAIELVHDPQEREVHADREGHGGDADDQGTEGHRGPDRMGDARPRRRGAPGTAIGSRSPSRRRRPPSPSTGRCGPAGDRGDRH